MRILQAALALTACLAIGPAHAQCESETKQKTEVRADGTRVKTLTSSCATISPILPTRPIAKPQIEDGGNQYQISFELGQVEVNGKNLYNQQAWYDTFEPFYNSNEVGKEGGGAGGGGITLPEGATKMDKCKAVVDICVGDAMRLMNNLNTGVCQTIERGWFQLGSQHIAAKAACITGNEAVFRNTRDNACPLKMATCMAQE